MYIDTEGVILKQIKTMDNRRIVLLFSKKYGKISAGSNIAEKGKSKSSLALKPFTYGKYELFKGRDTFHVNGAEVIRSFYGIGEDIDKYMCGSYVLEFTEKLLPENMAAPQMFDLLVDFLDMIERRGKKFSSLVVAYQLKALQINGNTPYIEKCVECGSESDAYSFSVKAGGLLCSKCRNFTNGVDTINDSLIYDVDFGIVNIIRYILDHPLNSFEKLALDEKSLKGLQEVLKQYIRFHLDIKDLKSESFLA
jgi:DNA repair protein RecO (recombination protein O)